MSSFTNLLVVSPLSDGKFWVIREKFIYYIGEENSDQKVEVEEGFVTDFASVPRMLWWLLPRWGVYGKAAVVHDYLYWKKIYNRKKSDEIFLEAMKVLKTPKIYYSLLFYGVRFFGWYSWKRNSKINKIFEITADEKKK